MEERFGKAFTRIEMRIKGPGSAFMESWERAKRSYRYERNRHGEPQEAELGPLTIDGEYPPDWYEKDYGMVLLSR